MFNNLIYQVFNTNQSIPLKIINVMVKIQEQKDFQLTSALSSNK
jgi:hypothetical protein